MRWLAVVWLLGGCHKLFGLEEIKAKPDGNGVWLEGYTYRKAITIRLGALTDFVVSVTTDRDPDLEAHARTDGRDIVFTDSNGVTVRDSEVVVYGSGTLDAWVQMPMLSAPTTTIFVYYGGPAFVSTTTPWGPDFAGVWHLAGQSSSEVDSTANGHNVVAGTNRIPMSVAGIAGAGREYDGVDDSMCGAGDGSLDQDIGSFGVSAWVNVSSSVGQYDQAINKGGNTAGSPGFSLELGTTDWVGTVGDGTDTLPLVITQETLGRWVYLAFFVDRSRLQVEGYADGAFTNMIPTAGLDSVSGTPTFCLGGQGGFPFKGILDEVRVYRHAIDRPKLTAEYANLADRANTIQISNEETL